MKTTQTQQPSKVLVGIAVGVIATKMIVGATIVSAKNLISKYKKNK